MNEHLDSSVQSPPNTERRHATGGMNNANDDA